ncbi:hypothetical protein CBW24_18105 (plasmid) [Pacificitalea manganoxidans]|uniref:Uncharacterized protein n=1 Tax=Pacificitalea manganoxidans TaxID=1411902 RepID=A0A291M4Z5_9RHOB|nr:hypothetical protein [Pacificitalea manganoxidans]ATI44056.1 hypothetical protein CBW24_18105 [Pacificitalea manganoxidans]MDR6310372.1 hypothetical protein [Pacificitalea manganoxidans]
MMSKGLQIAEPPRRRQSGAGGADTRPEKAKPAPIAKFDHVAEDEKVQFNKRVTRGVADGYEILAIRTRRKVPDLLAEALSLLEEKYGKV